MSQITVWKCDADGKLFEDKAKYQAHLRKLARERNIKRKLAIKEAAHNSWWAEAYEREMTIKEFAQFVIDNQDRFWAEAARSNGWDWQRIGKICGRGKNAVAMPIPKLLEFTVFDVRWSPSVSNSHDCPHNGVTNWGGRDMFADGSPKPTGYPGWRGRVEWLVAWPAACDGVYIGGDLFGSCGHNRRRAYTGTGGGGGMKYSDKHKCHVQKFGYDFRIFAADWPGMARAIAKQQFVDVLSGQRTAIDTGVLVV